VEASQLLQGMEVSGAGARSSVAIQVVMLVGQQLRRPVAGPLKEDLRMRLDMRRGRLLVVAVVEVI
jgi:hypothetical protein